MNRISVVVVTYRSADTIDACLASIPDGLELVVVDNASDDDTVARATAHGARVVTNDDNRGFAAGANQGAHATSGDTLLFLNPDAELAPGCLPALVRALESAPGVAVVGPAHIDSPDGPLIGYWPFPRAWRTWANELGAGRLLPPARPGDGFVVGTCMLVSRTWFDRVGGFDEDFWLYGEDADLCRKAYALGGASVVASDARIAHIGGHSSRRSDSFEPFHRGAELFIAKHDGARSLISHRVAVLVGAAIRAVVLRPGRPERARWFARLARRELRLLLHQPRSVAPRSGPA